MRCQDDGFDLAETGRAGAVTDRSRLVGAKGDADTHGLPAQVNRVPAGFRGFAPGDHVAAIGAKQAEAVVAIAADQRVGSGAAGDRVIACACIQADRRCGRSAVERVVLGSQDKGFDLAEAGPVGPVADVARF